jgi:RND family efflux transporter MFP subunit
VNFADQAAVYQDELPAGRFVNLMKQDSTARPRREPPQPTHSLAVDAVRIAAPLAVLAIGVVAFFALRGLKEAPVKAEEPNAVPTVETVVVAPHEGGLDFAVDGVVVPFREIDLSAEVAGRVATKAEVCRAGHYVARGTPLIEIDDRDYQLEAERLERELSQAGVTLRELEVEVTNTQSLIKLAKEQLTLQRRELERQRQLAGQRIVTDADHDKAKRDELTAINSLVTLENELQLLHTRRSRLESARDLWQSQLEKAQLDLARTKVSAPIDGVIIREMVEQDSYVQKGTSLVKLEDTSAVEVKCNLRMEELYWLWAQESSSAEAAAKSPTRDYQIPRAPVTVGYELAGRRYEWDGVLARFDGIGVDERTRTVPCRVLVANPRQVRVTGGDKGAAGPVGPPALVRGMYVTVSVHTQPKTRLLSIPQQAVQPGNTVWQAVDGKLAIHRIRVADTAEDRVLVYADPDGLQPGMKLVSSPLAAVADGMPVRERAQP